MPKGVYTRKIRPAWSRFLAKIKRKGECWEWQAYRLPNGYGLFSYRGKRVLAHRFAYIKRKGKIPKGMNVLHKCDNPPCVNPKHLFVGTQQDNLVDMTQKGRRSRKTGLKGEKHWKARLTKQQIKQIRNAVGKQIDIAEQYGISQAHVSAIQRGVAWSHV